MVKAKVWVINKKISGLPKLEDFTCLEEELPPCGHGDIVLEAEYLSVDPYMRYRINSINVNETPVGSQVARVIESQNEDFPVGCKVIGYPGWRSHTYVTKKNLEKSSDGFSYTKLPPMGPLPRSIALGVLGMPGNTAYFGLLEICQPVAGETVLVNGAAGAVGSLVCQIAKNKGCNVVAFVGSDAKVAWLKELGINNAFNYKQVNISEALKKSAPNGINCFFDNVGGQFTAECMPQMAEFGRIAICGAISQYNNEIDESSLTSLAMSPYRETVLLKKQLRLEGFIVSRWGKRWVEGITQMRKWIEKGELKYKETVTEGFENMPKAFIGLFHGDNIGKSIVKN